MLDFQVIASGSRGNAYLVTDGRTPLLLEAGLKARTLRKRGVQLSQVEGCLVTHEHQDHASGVVDLLKASVDVYLSQGTIDTLRVAGHRIHPVKARVQFSIGTWTIMPFDVPHDAEEPLGFLLTNQVKEKLLFVTDAHYVPYRFQGLTHVAIEANFDPEILKRNVELGALHPEVGKRLWSRHMSIETVKRFCQANDLSQVEQIFILHLSDGNSDAASFQNQIESLTGIPVTIAG